jgi:hypothetical protein
MRRQLPVVFLISALMIALSASNPAWASDAEPSMNQIYEAATTGHLDKAQDHSSAGCRSSENN